jgi:uncharacterized membrane protein
MNESQIRKVFKASVALKGVNALIEALLGLILYLVSSDQIVAWAKSLTLHELTVKPDDFVASHLLSLAQGFAVDSKQFYAFYLFSHGLIKLLLVIGLLRNKMWAYPVSLVVLGLFVVYQMYRFSYTLSFGLLALSVFDAFVMLLIWHEYRVVRGTAVAAA